jgi:hypothetical protein
VILVELPSRVCRCVMRGAGGLAAKSAADPHLWCSLDICRLCGLCAGERPLTPPRATLRPPVDGTKSADRPTRCGLSLRYCSQLIVDS